MVRLEGLKVVTIIEGYELRGFSAVDGAHARFIVLVHFAVTGGDRVTLVCYSDYSTVSLN